MNSHLLIRADGNARMGTGHVMRCLALAQGWQHTGGKSIFALAETTTALDARLIDEGFPLHCITAKPGTVEDSEQTIQLAKRNAAAWVVADGYHFGSDFQQNIKQDGLRLLLVDDYGHAEHYTADYILNQNLSACEESYKNREPYTRLLLGTRYVLLRGQFLDWRNWQRKVPPVARKVLVTLGGTDPDNVTGKVIEAVRGLDVEAKIVVGGSNPNIEKLRSQVSSLKSPVSLIVDANNMPELMAWADVAIAAGGTTSYELAFMGLPGLVFVLADNQRAVADELDTGGIAQKTTPDRVTEDLRALLSNAGRRGEMSRRGRQLVDGQGVNRVVEAIASTKTAEVLL